MLFTRVSTCSFAFCNLTSKVWNVYTVQATRQVPSLGTLANSTPTCALYQLPRCMNEAEGEGGGRMARWWGYEPTRTRYIPHTVTCHVSRVLPSFIQRDSDT